MFARASLALLAAQLACGDSGGGDEKSASEEGSADSTPTSGATGPRPAPT